MNIFNAMKGYICSCLLQTSNVHWIHVHWEPYNNNNNNIIYIQEFRALPPSTGRETIIIITGVPIITLLKRIFHNTISTVRVVRAAKSCEKLISTTIGGWALRSAGPEGTVISLVQIETDWGIGCVCK
jgi:hypothetical protein